MAIAEQLIECQLELLALDSNLERSGKREDNDSWFEFFFDDLQRRLPARCCYVSDESLASRVSWPS